MAKLAVVKTGGKQYLVKENDEIFVDKLALEKGKKLELETLAIIDSENGAVTLGKPLLKEKTKAEVLDTVQGDKVRVARFKAKVRYRKTRGFRAQLSKVKILKI